MCLRYTTICSASIKSSHEEPLFIPLIHLNPHVMTQAPSRNCGTASHRETFHKFFECWIVEQNRFLQELIAASKNHHHHHNGDGILRPLLHRVIHHYEQYYSSKSTWAKADILAMFNPSWRSSLEDAFLWIGGWRPSMAFHLLYSKSGLQLEARLTDLLQGLSTDDLGDLSSRQLERVDKLQSMTVKEEKAITEKLAKHQERVADPAMVELAHVATELLQEMGQAMDDGRLEATLASKEEGLVEVLQMADDLRLKTLRDVIELLSPIQSVHFLIAAAELHLRVHEWGKKRDARHVNNQVAVDVANGAADHS